MPLTWINLSTSEELTTLKEKSKTAPQLIFKHSTRCNISSTAKGRLERDSQPVALDFYYLDLIKYRALSNEIAETFKVHHESPQVLLIRNGECVYEESHLGISMDDIREQVAL